MEEEPRGAQRPPLDSLHEEEAERYDRRHAGAQKRASVVGTASYRHTLMRCALELTLHTSHVTDTCDSVRTMSEAGLAARIKAIERAKGQHAVVKMRLFARVLFLEQYEELAHDATEALQRLIAVLGDVVSDDEAAEDDK